MNNEYIDNLYVQEDYVHRQGDKHTRMGVGEPYLTRFNTVGDLYRSCRREYGKCIGKAYTGDKVQCGWVFEKKAPDGYGIAQVWVTVFTKLPVKRVVVEGEEYPTFRRERKR